MAAQYHLGGSEREIGRDSQGRLEIVERRRRDPSNAFVLDAPVTDWEDFEIRLPGIHPTGKYSIAFVLDRKHPRWDEIEGDEALEPPLRVEPGASPAGGAYLFRHGAIYFASNGHYVSTVVLADGKDLRRTPLEAEAWARAGPGEPRLEVRARAAPLVGERGYELYIWLIVPDPIDRAGEVSKVLQALRERLDEVRSGLTTASRELENVDVSWLIGSSRDEILGALGEPDYCVLSRGRGALGVAFLSEACAQDEAELVYRFYHLPSGNRGGGKELRLVFGERDRCTSPIWKLTQ